MTFVIFRLNVMLQEDLKNVTPRLQHSWDDFLLVSIQLIVFEL